MSPINPGIRATVDWLTSHGFQTTDSGDGETRDYLCDQPRPYVHMLVPAAKLVAETDRLVELLRGRGVQVQAMDEDGATPTLEASYNPADGAGGVISLWNVRL